ncbi:MAG: very short patch repair endonuclease [Rickettsiales bacterium]|nr:very short patch repair endonuclease [Pseudomonadota bacterium]MDA0965644.1 very short patch repair endonuclease [Pseudomonadota bacterium]MDG4544584.1 very short patch repair endonuclease [Rickettsiales bacterium]
MLYNILMDIFTKEKRSKVMSAVKGKDTKPEIMLRKAIFKQGFRYSLHTGSIEGKPDIYLKKYNAVIFFHGCFWHGHNCKAGALPKTRTEFWKKKIESNKCRDLKVINVLKEKGYRVLIIWGCSLKGKGKERFDTVVNKTICWINSNNNINEITNKCFE